MKIYIILILILFLITFSIKEYLSSISSESNNYKLKNIYFGQTIDLDNNIAKLYFKGFQLAFQSVNRKGGLKGYIINIVLLNDQYNKQLAVKNASLLVNYYNVLALIGTFGTSTIMEIINTIVNKKNVALIAPFSGSPLLRTSFNKNIILTSGSLIEEYDLLFKIFRQNKITNISIIYQNDEYGYSYLNSLTNYIITQKEKINIMSIASYERNSIFLYDTYKKLFQINKPYLETYSDKNITQIQAIILFTTETQISSILGTLKKINPSVFIYYNFFVGNNILNYKVIENNSSNIYQTLSSYNIQNKYPDLYNKFLEEVNYYNEFVKLDEITSINKIDNFTNTLYQGFYSGLLIIEVLKSFDNLDTITRQTFIDRFYQIKNFDIYGLKIGPFEINKNNIGISYASINKVVDKKLVTIDEIDSNENNKINQEYNKVSVELEKPKVDTTIYRTNFVNSINTIQEYNPIKKQFNYILQEYKNLFEK